MVTSEKKLLSNRMNLLKAHSKSTGPRNTSRTRFNAVKHGMTSRRPVMLPYENWQEFHGLQQSIRNVANPKRDSDESVTERIAYCLWKLRRGIVAEQGIICEHATGKDGVRWNDLMWENYFPKIIRYEKRLMLEFQKLLSKFKGECIG